MEKRIGEYGDVNEARGYGIVFRKKQDDPPRIKLSINPFIMIKITRRRRTYIRKAFIYIDYI